MAEFQTLASARHTANLLLKRIHREDPDAADRFEAYLDRFWNDQVSVEEAISDMRDLTRSFK